jgi:hypothetical protein
MKTILLLLITTVSFGQNLSLTGNITLPLQGGNCGNGPTTELTYQDINLNGYTITLRNVKLIATANLNGPGEIKQCGNQSNSTVCVSGAMQNNPNLNGLSCAVLGEQEFEFIQKNYGKKFEVKNILSQTLQIGVTDEYTYSNLPYQQLLFVFVEGFEVKKIIKR